MAKRRKTGSKRGFSTRMPSALGTSVRRRVTNQPQYARNTAPFSRTKVHQAANLLTAKPASVKTRGTRQLKRQKRIPPLDLSRSDRMPRSPCESRSVRREAIFATGYGGKTGPQRPHQPKSKVRC